ncbi:MAG: acetolactate synthase small subunit [Acidobacteriota bacterium]|nr:acetolactate synthase small subunit [Acidobacteriota bacterium]
MMEKHTIIITVVNKVGVLARIAGLLSSRAYNIESVIGAPTENPDVYKIHLVICGTAEKIEQVTKQLNKLIDTIKVVDISHKKNYIIREFLLIKVNALKNRSEIFKLVDVFKAKVVDLTRTQVTIELSGPPFKIGRFIDLLKPYGIKEFIRSGSVAVSQNEFQHKENKK